MATETKVPVVAARGGSFLIEERTPDEIFTPEDFSEEQVMIGQTADDFMVKELVPRLPEFLKTEVNFPLTGLEPGEYEVRATLTEGQATREVERRTFKHEIPSLAAPPPAQRVAPPLPPAVQPTPYKLELCPGGGFADFLDRGHQQGD